MVMEAMNDTEPNESNRMRVNHFPPQLQFECETEEEEESIVDGEREVTGQRVMKKKLRREEHCTHEIELTRTRKTDD